MRVALLIIRLRNESEDNNNERVYCPHMNRYMYAQFTATCNGRQLETTRDNSTVTVITLPVMM